MMKLAAVKDKIPSKLFDILDKEIEEFRPAQEKAIDQGLLRGKSLLVCTPTASGKTLIAELAAVKNIIDKGGKCVYIVPLKALASEKFKDFKRKYDGLIRIALSIGNLDSADPYLAEYDLLIVTAEKMDSLLRHHAPWIKDVSVLVVDEVHLLNDIGRGPTLEILITLMKRLIKDIQVIALSATIGNPDELAEWLEAELVIDTWRPVKLHKGVFFDKEIEFY
jgi:helicase